jgi:hypothetical protein
MMTATQKQAAIRRDSFEKHVADCDVCQAPANAPDGAMPVMCFAGTMMLAHFVRAIKRANLNLTEAT